MRGWLGHTLLIVFFLKALIPMGFMPELSSASGKAFKIVICTASGPKILTAGLDGTPEQKSVAKHMSDFCALGGVAAVTLPSVTSEISGARVGSAERRSFPLAVALPPARAGPAHSPRAPPFLV